MRSMVAMVKKGRSVTEVSQNNTADIRKGPWTLDEDAILVNYITAHGEGHWNSLARYAGLRRSGKSCRLRWLNYLRPNVRRGNITLQEQILILELHSRWGNRWSKIAQHLPGRTDNEIKNYWRTRVIKQAKQLNCDVNSEQFRDTLRHVWMPRLLERVQLDRNPNPCAGGLILLQQNGTESVKQSHCSSFSSISCPSGNSSSSADDSSSMEFRVASNSDPVGSSDQFGEGSDLRPSFNKQLLEQGNGIGDDSLESLWNDESMWFLHQNTDNFLGIR